MNEFLDTIINAVKRDEKTKPYDTTATVRRIDGNTAWCHIDGGVDETPVRMTIDAAVGDVVQVRVGGGTAFLVGNATAPPTDDTTAIQARLKSLEAASMARSAEQTANSALSSANSAYYLANGAMTSANGKNTIYYSTTEPTGGDYKTGDTWFKMDTVDNVTVCVGMYTWDGDSWELQPLADGAFASLDVGKLVGGYIDAQHINVAGIISAGSIIVSGDNISSLTNDSGYQTASDVSGDIISATTLYYASNSTTPPNKPNAHVTTNNANTRGAWNLALPTYSESYPYLYTCTETKTKGGTYAWTAVQQSSYASAVASIKETADSAAPKADAVSRSQRIYYRKTSSGAPSKNTTWLTTSGSGYGNWSLSIPQLMSGTTKYPYLYTAVQTQTVAQQAAGNACSCSDVLLDDSNTVIDGGSIVTGTIDANMVNITNLTMIGDPNGARAVIASDEIALINDDGEHAVDIKANANVGAVRSYTPFTGSESYITLGYTWTHTFSGIESGTDVYVSLAMMGSWIQEISVTTGQSKSSTEIYDTQFTSVRIGAYSFDGSTNTLTIAADEDVYMYAYYYYTDVIAPQVEMNGQLVVGQNYQSASNMAVIVGNGTSSSAKSNALTVDWNGNVMTQGMAGMIQMFAGKTAPTGWLLCDGRSVSRTTYATLFSVIGTTYGSGDGSTTFNIPDMRGRVAVGVGTGTATDATAHTLGQKSGTETVKLTASQSGVPAHSHDNTFKLKVASPDNTGTLSTSQVQYGRPTGTTYTNANAISGSVSDNTAAGASSAHSNMQPYIGLNYIICTGKTA